MITTLFESILAVETSLKGLLSYHRCIKYVIKYVNELHEDGKTYHSDSDILKGFREHFQSLSTPNDVPGYDKNYGDLVTCEVREIIDINFVATPRTIIY